MDDDAADVVRTMVKLDAVTARALEGWIASMPAPRPTQEVALGMALHDFLTGLGRLPHNEPAEPGWH